MKATKEQIIQWLDLQIGAMYIQRQVQILTPKVKANNLSKCDYIHISSKALRFIAKELDLPITVSDRGDTDEYKYELEFRYKDIKFLSIESAKEYRKNGELA